MSENLETTEPDKESKKKSDQSRLKARLRDLEFFTEVIPDGVVIINNQLIVEASNEFAQSLLGFPEDSIGSSLEDLIEVPRLSNYVRKTAQQEPLEFTSPIQKDSTLEARLFNVDKDTKVIVVRDITTLNRLLTMRQSFVANVSHELRTPLTVVKGYLETMVDESAPDELRLSLISKLSAPVSRMESLVQDLLLLTQLESNPVPPEMDEINMNDVIRNACNEVQGLLAESDKISIVNDCDKPIKGIATELNSLCTNLISNAVRYSPDGADIEISWASLSDSTARLSVKDSGIGIAKEHIDRITERFYRVDMKNSRARGGTGLGLAIVKHVLRRHNSELEVKSRVNEGSLFYCDFEF